MSVALFGKTAYQQRWAFTIVSFVAALFPAAMMNAFASMPWDLVSTFMERTPWIGRLIRVLTGADFHQILNTNAMPAFIFVHPVMLTLTWGYIIMSTTRLICGEIDRGTIDLLLTVPLSRWRVYLSVSAWPAICVPWLMACLWFGIWVGSRTADIPAPVDVWDLRFVVVNAAACLLAVAGTGMLFSAAGSRRGLMVGAVVGILVTSFLLNWLAAFWPRVQSLSILSILHYFRPFVIILDSRYQTADLAVLLAVALGTWTAGGLIFARRDIPSA